MTEANAINAATIGIVGNTGTAFTGTAVTQYNVIVGGSTSSTLTNVAPSATSGVPLISQGAASNPVFGTAVVAGGGTGAVTLTGVLIGNGTSAVTGNAITQYDVLVGGAANAISSVGPGSVGQVLQSGGNAANPAYSTATYPLTTTINQLLYSSSANVVGGITAANNGVLISGTTGVPSWLANSGTAGFVLTANTGAPPSWQAASGGSGITTINGDSGSITGSTVTIYANAAALNSGATVSFINSGTTSTFNVTDVHTNTMIGNGAGVAGMGGGQNIGLGYLSCSNLTNSSDCVAVGNQSLQNLVSGSSNVAIGNQSLQLLTSPGSNNTGCGQSSLQALLTGNYNIGIGNAAGTQYKSSESSNIAIGHVGVTGESNVIRIGTQGSGSTQQNACYIAGIEGVSVSNLNYVTINTSTGQLGSVASIPAILTVTSVAHGASPYTVLSTDQFLACQTSGGVITIKLPNAPTTGRVIYIKDSNGAAATSNISVTTVGGTVTIDGATTFTMNVNYQAISVVFDGTNYEVF